MRHAALVTLAPALLAATAATAAEPPRRTLAELIQLARERAPQIGPARADIDIRRAQKREALYAWAPTGELTYYLTGAPRVECRGPGNDNPRDNAGGYDTANPLTRSRDCVRTVDPGSGASVSFFNFNLAGVGMQGQITLAQPLYTFGRIENATRAAGHGIAAAEAQLEGVRGEVELLVAKAYWGLKAARAALATIQDGRGELSPWLAKIEADLDAPKPQYTLSDLQRIKIGLAQVDLLSADMERNVQVAGAGLATLCGEAVEIDERELDVVEIVERPLDFYADALRSNRPELRALEQGLLAYRALARWKRAEMLPLLALGANFTFRYAPTIEDSQSAFDQKANMWGIGAALVLQQPLDLIMRWARVRHADADADLLAAQRLAALGGFGYEVAQAHADLGEARHRVEIAARGQRTARGWLTGLQQTLDLGTGEPRDIVEAARSYFELRLRYYQAIHDVNVATARLRRAAGIEIAPPGP